MESGLYVDFLLGIIPSRIKAHFQIPVLVCFVGFTLVKGYNAVCGIGGAAMETLSADRIVEV